MAAFSGERASSAAAILSSVLENIKNLPASSPEAHSSSSSAPRYDYGGRLFGRQKPLHDLLGGGQSADVFLWRKKNLSAGFLAGATAIWVLFEWIGYHFISVFSFFLMVVVVGLFIWSHAATFLNRAPPSVPKVELSDELVLRFAKNFNVGINQMFNLVYDIAVGRDIIRFGKLVAVLVFLVLFGNWFHFLTLLYLAIVAVHTLPILYEKNEDVIERFAEKALNELNNQFRKVDASVFSRIPRGPAVQKKAE